MKRPLSIVLRRRSRTSVAACVRPQDGRVRDCSVLRLLPPARGDRVPFAARRLFQPVGAVVFEGRCGDDRLVVEVPVVFGAVGDFDDVARGVVIVVEVLEDGAVCQARAGELGESLGQVVVGVGGPRALTARSVDDGRPSASRLGGVVPDVLGGGSETRLSVGGSASVQRMGDRAGRAYRRLVPGLMTAARGCKSFST